MCSAPPLTATQLLSKYETQIEIPGVQIEAYLLGILFLFEIFLIVDNDLIALMSHSEMVKNSYMSQTDLSFHG